MIKSLLKLIDLDNYRNCTDCIYPAFFCVCRASFAYENFPHCSIQKANPNHCPNSGGLQNCTYTFQISCTTSFLSISEILCLTLLSGYFLRSFAGNRKSPYLSLFSPHCQGLIQVCKIKSFSVFTMAVRRLFLMFSFGLYKATSRTMLLEGGSLDCLCTGSFLFKVEIDFT